MQETNVYVYLTPIALIFILLEVFFCWLYRKDYISFPEAVANFGTALGNQTMNVLIAAGVYVIYGFLWENYRIFTIEMNWWTFILLLLGVDFIFYWVHRWGHAINIMWAAHSPHHSAEEMNFFVALRASVTQRMTSFLFFWVLTIIGFHPLHIYMMTGIHLFIAFLHHTELVPKLWRPIEFVFTTPSHHRVHHGVNFKYLDKNFGEFLIIWDRIFGSFAEEDEKVVYGIYDHPKSWNPISINFHFYMVLWNYARQTPFWWDKMRVWFMPAGWRPRGLPEKEMVEITTENQMRFRPLMFSGAKIYLILQSRLWNCSDDRHHLESLRLDKRRKMDRRVSSVVADRQLGRHSRSQTVDLDVGKSARHFDCVRRHNFQRNFCAVAGSFRFNFSGVFFDCLDKFIFSTE